MHLLAYPICQVLWRTPNVQSIRKQLGWVAMGVLYESDPDNYAQSGPRKMSSRSLKQTKMNNNLLESQIRKSLAMKLKGY